MKIKQDPTTGDVQLLGLVNADTIPYEDIDELIAALTFLKWDEELQTAVRTESLAERFYRKRIEWSERFDTMNSRARKEYINYHIGDLAYDMVKEYGGDLEDYLV